MSGLHHPRPTSRLRLVPVRADLAEDLWLVHADDAVWPWYGARRPTRTETARRAASMAESWRLHGVHKWIAYERDGGRVVGRGGLSRTPADADWGQLHALLPEAPWVRETHASRRPGTVHAHWLEIGWAIRGDDQGRGYATEIGRAGLAAAFDDLGADAVVSCTVRHNARSRAVMERIGMRFAGEITSRGVVEGGGEERADAAYSVHVLLRAQWRNGISSG